MYYFHQKSVHTVDYVVKTQVERGCAQATNVLHASFALHNVHHSGHTDRIPLTLKAVSSRSPSVVLYSKYEYNTTYVLNTY